MNLQEFKAQLINANLSETDLRSLNTFLVSMIRADQAKNARLAILTFEVGNTAQFEHKGRAIRGKVTKLNDKTVEVTVIEKRSLGLINGEEKTYDHPVRWKVSPSLLTKIEA